MKNTINIKARKVTSFEKISGLVGKNNPEPIFFYTSFGIHTFGLKFPIDVVILNKRGKIASIYQGVKPNRIMFWNPRHNIVLELPQGFVKKKSLNLGTQVNLLQ